MIDEEKIELPDGTERVVLRPPGGILAGEAAVEFNEAMSRWRASGYDPTMSPWADAAS